MAEIITFNQFEMVWDGIRGEPHRESLAITDSHTIIATELEPHLVKNWFRWTLLYVDNEDRQIWKIVYRVPYPLAYNEAISQGEFEITGDTDRIPNDLMHCLLKL